MGNPLSKDGNISEDMMRRDGIQRNDIPAGLLAAPNNALAGNGEEAIKAAVEGVESAGPVSNEN